MCVENAANIVTTGSGTYTASPAANYSANPALGLSGLACGQPGLPPLQASITNFSYLNYCTSPSGRSNYAQWTAAARGGTGVYSYAWYVDYQNTGNYQSTGNTSTIYGTCLNGYTSYVQLNDYGL